MVEGFESGGQQDETHNTRRGEPGPVNYGRVKLASTKGSSAHSATMTSTQRPIVFMDINIGETPAGRLKMELFSDVVPKFVTACHSNAIVRSMTLSVA